MKPFPDNEYIDNICKIGQAAACCRYLTMGSDGWSCEKHGSLKNIIDKKVAAADQRTAQAL